MDDVFVNNSDWDDRDAELGLREKLATVISEIASGIENATPASFDYVLADKFRAMINNEVG